MPGWHNATLKQQAAGDFQMLGIIQEQHPDRARLFMQWKQMEWPILVDSLNLLETSMVPRTLLIDEYGVIRSLRARPPDLDEFLATRFDPPPAVGSEPGTVGEAPESSAGEEIEALHRAFMSGDTGELDRVIDGYASLLRARPGDGTLRFRLGVAYRARYDSEHHRPGDFAQAVSYWKRALELDPNQYIWRRRLQQYGPRLDKPYSFYDWVPQARSEITDRGETPAALGVEPDGAEFADPAEQFELIAGGRDPDPGGRIFRDDGLIGLESVLVPDTSGNRHVARVHLTLFPNAARRAHWNNEVDDLVVWVNPPAGWQVDRRLMSAPSPPEPVSHERRRVEFEIRALSDSGAAELVGYALYYVCEDVDGTCLYRRQDFSIAIE